jgi:four helix bundle protein
VRRQSRKHHDLEVWRDGLDLVSAIYRLTSSFPSDERFGLTAQLRRAAVSIPSNIAEGAARKSRLDLLRFLDIARSSLAEVETQLEIAHRLDFLAEDSDLDELIDRLFAKPGALIHSLQPTTAPPS